MPSTNILILQKISSDIHQYHATERHFPLSPSHHPLGVGNPHPKLEPAQGPHQASKRYLFIPNLRLPALRLFRECCLLHTIADGRVELWQ